MNEPKVMNRNDSQSLEVWESWATSGGEEEVVASAAAVEFM